MSKQEEKREAGASRKPERRQRIDITLPQEVIDYLDKQKISRSRYIEVVLRTQMETNEEYIEYLNWQREEQNHGSNKTTTP